MKLKNVKDSLKIIYLISYIKYKLYLNYIN